MRLTSRWEVIRISVRGNRSVDPKWNASDCVSVTCWRYMVCSILSRFGTMMNDGTVAYRTNEPQGALAVVFTQIVAPMQLDSDVLFVASRSVWILFGAVCTMDRGRLGYQTGPKSGMAQVRERHAAALNVDDEREAPTLSALTA
jgi:hypothetical protein